MTESAGMNNLPILTADSISVQLAGRSILKDVSLTLSTGEILVIMGASGCGKTTLLRCLAGELTHSGTVQLAPKSTPGNARGNNSATTLLMQQQPLLFEHLTVFDNIAFSPRMRSVSPAEVTARTAHVLDILELQDVATQYPQELSGGQKQRCAFGRALLAEPSILLMDEPFSGLDNDVRMRLQQFFRELCPEFGISSVFVTHDLREALIVGTRFGLLRDGQLQLWPNAASFAAAPETGVRREIDFWQNMKSISD